MVRYRNIYGNAVRVYGFNRFNDPMNPINVAFAKVDDATSGKRGKVKRRENEDDDDNSSQRRASPTEIAARYNNDPVQIAGHAANVEHDNYILRKKNRELRDDMAELEDKVPGEDSMVLTNEEKEEFEGFRKLGKLAEVTATVGKVTQLEAQLNETKQKDLLRKVADNVAPGVKYDAEVLADLVSRTPGLEFSEREVAGEDGVKVKAQFVTFKEGESKKDMKLTEFVEEKWPRYKPSLLATQPQSNDAYGAVVPEQLPSGGNNYSGADTMVDDFMASTYGLSDDKK